MLYGFAETRVVELTRVRLGLGYRVAFLTDLHIHSWGRVEKRIVSLVNKESPDVVILGGDIIDRLTTSLKPVSRYLSLVKARELYSVLGNHDYQSGRLAELREVLEGLGYEVLTDSWGNSKIGLIYGVDWRDDRRYPRVVARDALVVAHDPNAALNVVGGRLMLSGHTHGGVIVCGVVVYTNSIFTRGLYRTPGGTTLYVARGVGQMIPLRPSSPLEIVVVE